MMYEAELRLLASRGMSAAELELARYAYAELRARPVLFARGYLKEDCPDRSRAARTKLTDLKRTASVPSRA